MVATILVRRSVTDGVLEGLVTGSNSPATLVLVNADWGQAPSSFYAASEYGRTTVSGAMSQYRFPPSAAVPDDLLFFESGKSAMSHLDTRRPNPPMGYACECHLPRSQQMALVAEFHVHRIRPSRIAFRLGIDIEQVEAWLTGEQDGDQFRQLMLVHRQRKYQAQLRRADRMRGQRAYDMRLAAQRDLNDKVSLD